MHKFFTIFTFALLLSEAAYGQLQACVPALINADTSIIIPEPYNFDDMTGGLDSTCAGLFYEQILTTLVPQSINFGGSDLSIDSIAIEKVGAIENLPIGYDYACNPPSCVFYPDSIACFVISGTTDEAVEVKTYDLTLKITVYNPLVPAGLNITYPDDLGNANESYFIDVAAASNCMLSSNNEILNNNLAWTIAPNPATNFVQLKINAVKNIDLQLSITDILGRTQYQKRISILDGQNEMDLNLLDLEKGIYFINLSDGESFISQKLVIE